jgi:hypothetical protein
MERKYKYVSSYYSLKERDVGWYERQIGGKTFAKIFKPIEGLYIFLYGKNTNAIHKGKFLYCINDNFDEVTRDEFKLELEKRKSKLWKTLYD